MACAASLFYRQTVFIASSTELLAFDPSMRLTGRWSNPYLKHCQEISVHQDQVFIASAGYDSIIAFDIKKQAFHWALHVENDGYRILGNHFNPSGDEGPLQLNKLHINSITTNEDGMYIGGLRTGGLLHFNGRSINMSAEHCRKELTTPSRSRTACYSTTPKPALFAFASQDYTRDPCVQGPTAPAGRRNRKRIG